MRMEQSKKEQVKKNVFTEDQQSGLISIQYSKQQNQDNSDKLL